MNVMDFELSLGFENVAIKQKKNLLKSRLDADIRSEVIRGVFLDVPLIAANMSTVTNADFCILLEKLGCMGIMHRAAPDEELENQIDKIQKAGIGNIAASIGIGEGQIELAKKLINKGARILCIDIAHGYSDFMLEFGRKLKKEFPEIKLILGNTTNTEMLKECSDFADCLKVGISQGFACETAMTTGCDEKQFSVVLKFKEISRQYGIPIISDGGIRISSDMSKAIAAGASGVMMGKNFAECVESAGEVVEVSTGKYKKLYAGMASEHVQKQWRGGLKSGTCAEGGVRYLDMNDGAANLVEHYAGSLRSAITYGGGTDIKSFQDNVEFVRFI